MAVLVRVFHGVPVKGAQEAVDSLTERKISLIWDPGPVRRVLEANLKASDQTLLLLHQSMSWVEESHLIDSAEYKNSTKYRSILLERHKGRLIEYDRVNKRAKISPKGGLYVEEELLATRAKRN
jgi:hypothetical protein